MLDSAIFMADISSFFGLRVCWLLARGTSSAGELVTGVGWALLASFTAKVCLLAPFTAEGLVATFTTEGRWVSLVVAGVGLVVSWDTRSLASWGLATRGLACIGLAIQGLDTRGLDTAWGLKRPLSRILATFGALSRGLTALAEVWPVLGLLSLARSLLLVAVVGLASRVAWLAGCWTRLGLARLTGCRTRLGLA